MNVIEWELLHSKYAISVMSSENIEYYIIGNSQLGACILLHKMLICKMKSNILLLLAVKECSISIYFFLFYLKNLSMIGFEKYFNNITPEIVLKHVERTLVDC